MGSAGERGTAELLAGLTSERVPEAWRAFLDLYAPAILQVVRLFEQETDDANDCFLYICERLAADQFRRLRAYRTDGPASFPTWLRSVARNLCIDWHRKKHGRLRDGLYRTSPRIQQLAAEDDSLIEWLRDPSPDPESQAVAGEFQAALRHSLRRLSGDDRLLLRLRFEQDLTLDQIARMTGMSLPQAVDRRLRKILVELRDAIEQRGGKLEPKSV